MNKLKLIILASIILPTAVFNYSSVKANEEVVESSNYVPSPEFEFIADVYNEVTGNIAKVENALEEQEFFEKLDPLTMVKMLSNIGNRFMDIDTYPKVSMYECCDVIIYLLDRAEDLAEEKIPTDLKDNIVQLIKDKRESTGAINFNSGHKLTNDIIIQMVDFMMAQITKHVDEIQKHLEMNDIIAIANELNAFKSQAEANRRVNKHLKIADLADEIEKIGKRLQPIWESFAKNNPDYNFEESDDNEKKSSGGVVRWFQNRVEQAKQSYNNMKIINYRISMNDNSDEDR